MSSLADPGLVKLIIAVLVKRLGGEVNLTQADIDEIAYGQLFERRNDDGVSLKVVPRVIN